MCHKIRCDGKSWKLFGFQSELNKARVDYNCKPPVMEGSGKKKWVIYSGYERAWAEQRTEQRERDPAAAPASFVRSGQREGKLASSRSITCTSCPAMPNQRRTPLLAPHMVVDAGYTPRQRGGPSRTGALTGVVPRTMTPAVWWPLQWPMGLTGPCESDSKHFSSSSSSLLYLSYLLLLSIIFYYVLFGSSHF